MLGRPLTEACDLFPERARYQASSLEALERKAREEAERKAKEEVERNAKEKAQRNATEEAERKAKEDAERRLTAHDRSASLGDPQSTATGWCDNISFSSSRHQYWLFCLLSAVYCP